MFLLLPFDSLVVNLLGISITVLFTLLLVFIIVPAIFGVSFGIRKVYMKTLLKIFQVSHVFRMFHVFVEVCPSMAMLKKRGFRLRRALRVTGVEGWAVDVVLLPVDLFASSQPNAVYEPSVSGLVFFFPVINLVSGQVKQ